MAAPRKYDYRQIRKLRDEGYSWEEIRELLGAPSTSVMRSSYYHGQKRARLRTGKEEGEDDIPDETSVEVTGTSPHRITSLEDLFNFFGIAWEYEHTPTCDDKESTFDGCDCGGVPISPAYEVLSFRCNSWEQHSVKKGIVTLYQVRATLRVRESIERRQVIENIWADFRDDASNYAPSYIEAPPVVLNDPARPQMLEIALLDPHLGMLAWGKEVGLPYDLEIGKADYRRAFNYLLSLQEFYNIEKILFLVGSDLFHVDSPGFDAKGRSRGGATTKGTMQDLDTRLARLFTHVRRLIVECINDARLIAPVDVQITPGNHDRHTMYKLGEVLEAWYRKDERVTVRNSPSIRDYYLYGSNVFMFTHGEEFERKRDNLVSVFSTECPPEMWVAGRVREVHVGHCHISKEKIYTGDPTNTLWEGRACRVRSLPGLTTEDAWHFEEGYKHSRRGTALVWHREGGLAGLHEFTL